MQTNNLSNLKILVLSLVVLLATTAFSALAQWTPAPPNAPSCPSTIAGCNPPLNTGSTAQAKLGGLTIGGATPPANGVALSIPGTGIIDTGGLIANQITLRSAGSVEGKVLGAISDDNTHTFNGAIGWVDVPSSSWGTQDCYLLRVDGSKELYVAPDGFYVKGSFGSTDDEFARQIYMMCRVASTPDDPLLPSASNITDGLLASCNGAGHDGTSDSFGLDAYCGYGLYSDDGSTINIPLDRLGVVTYPESVASSIYNNPPTKGKLYPRF
jgi:hypothetical protein